MNVMILSAELKEYIIFGRQLLDGCRAQTERDIDQLRRVAVHEDEIALSGGSSRA